MESRNELGAATSKYGRRYSLAEHEAILARCRAGGLRLGGFAAQTGVSHWSIGRWTKAGKRGTKRPILARVLVKEASVDAGVISAFPVRDDSSDSGRSAGGSVENAASAKLSFGRPRAI
jgi:hypothetical protein